jgi:hypothetical protein
MELVSTRRRTAPSAVRARLAATRLTVMAVGGAGTLAGVAFVLALGWLRGEVPVRTAAAAATAATIPPSTATTPLVEAPPAPAWTGDRKASWASDGSKTIVFELRAMRDAPAWMTSVRPVLVVQCLSRTTQMFVALGTSATFESDSFHRTVRVQWDDETELVQRWQASESGQELFAPDGVAFVRRLAGATRLRFGFTPPNPSWRSSLSRALTNWRDSSRRPAAGASDDPSRHVVRSSRPPPAICCCAVIDSSYGCDVRQPILKLFF